MSKSFNDNVLRHSSFFSKLCLLAIDELHLVSEWREFRSDYFGLGILRARLPDGIPFLGASATLDRQTVEVVKESCTFVPNTAVIKTPLDRPEIYMQVSQILLPLNGMLDLQQVLPARACTSMDVPKPIIFMDSIQSIKKACTLLRAWMNQLNYPANCADWVAPFFADMAVRDKKRVAAQFGRPAAQCLAPRVLVATDAYGLGIDNPDIERVWQWDVPSSTQKLYQRMGRAMRSGLGQATFVLLYPPWCFGSRGGNATTNTHGTSDVEAETDTNPRGNSKKRKDIARRQRLAPGLWDIINVSPGTCIRAVGLEFFDDNIYKTPAYVKPKPCCAGCDPEFAVSTGAHAELNKKEDQDSLRRPWLTKRLQEWRQKAADAEFSGTFMRFFPSLIMPDSVLASLANWAEYIHDEQTMRRWVGNGWSSLPHYCTEILQIIARSQKLVPDAGEVFDEWALHHARKRKRLSAGEGSKERVAFEQRRGSWLASQGNESVGVVRGRKATKSREHRRQSLGRQAVPASGATMLGGGEGVTSQASGAGLAGSQPTPGRAVVFKTPRASRVQPQRTPRTPAPILPFLSRNAPPSRSRPARRRPARFCN